MVAAYYLKLGCQVYFPVVRQGIIDMIVQMEGGLFAVQVKGAWWNKSGPHSYLQCRMRTTNVKQIDPAHGAYDLVLVVYEDEIWEIPAAEIKSSNICLRGTHPKHKGSPWERYKVT